MTSRTTTNPIPTTTMSPTLDSSFEINPTPTPPAATLAWRVWPVADHWTNRWLPLLVIVGIFGVVWLVSGLFWTALLAAAIVLACMWQTFVPVYYELGPAGIRTRRLGRQQLQTWQSIRHCRFLQQGLLLLPDRATTDFDRLRGRYIAWNQHGDAVRRLTSYYLRVTSITE